MCPCVCVRQCVDWCFHGSQLKLPFRPQVEREKLKTEEVATKTVMQRGELDAALQSLERENHEMARALQATQNQLSEAEQAHAQR